MTKRIATLALALALTAPASAFAQGFNAPGFDAPRVDRTETRSFFGMPAWVDDVREGAAVTRDTATTGSIAPFRDDAGRVAPQAGLFAR